MIARTAIAARCDPRQRFAFASATTKRFDAALLPGRERAGYVACDTRVSPPRSTKAVSDPSPSPRPIFLTSGQRPRPRRAPPARRHPRAARQGQWRQGAYVPLEGHGRGHLRRPAGHRPRTRNGGLQVPRWLRLGRHRGTLLTHDTHPRTRLRTHCPSIRRSSETPGRNTPERSGNRGAVRSAGSTACRRLLGDQTRTRRHSSRHTKILPHRRTRDKSLTTPTHATRTRIQSCFQCSFFTNPLVFPAPMFLNNPTRTR